MQLASDTFPGNTLSGNWTAITALFDVVSGELEIQASGASTFTAMYYNNATWPNDQYSQITVTTVGASSADGMIGPAVRASSSAITYYWALAYGGALYIQLVVAGTTITNLNNAAYTPSNGDTIYLGVQGTTLTAKVNGSTVVTASDSTLASGNAGIVGYGGPTHTWQVTPWSGGNFVVASTGTNQLMMVGCGT